MQIFGKCKLNGGSLYETCMSEISTAKSNPTIKRAIDNATYTRYIYGPRERESETSCKRASARQAGCRFIPDRMFLYVRRAILIEFAVGRRSCTERAALYVENRRTNFILFSKLASILSVSLQDQNTWS